MREAELVPLGDLMPPKKRSVDPSKHPNEMFELYSIPAFDSASPEVAAGRDIGSSKQIVAPGDVLLSKIVPHIRRAWVVGAQNGRRLIASSEWIVFRHPSVHPAYLRHILLGDRFHAQLMQTVSGVGGSLLRARPSYVADIEIPLPPLPEQRRIAAILDKADALRAKRRRALERLDELTQSIFLDFYLSKSHSVQTTKLSELCERNAPITYGILQPGPNLPAGVPYVRPSEIHNGSIDLPAIRRTSPEIAKKYAKSVIRSGDLLITIVGTIGKVAVVPEELDGGNITQSSARIRVDSSKADPTFVATFLRSHLAHREYDRHRLGVAVERLNLHHVRDLEIGLPPLRSQRDFSNRLRQLGGIRDHQRSTVVNLDGLFAALQQSAFRGDL